MPRLPDENKPLDPQKTTPHELAGAQAAAQPWARAVLAQLWGGLMEATAAVERLRVAALAGCGEPVAGQWQHDTDQVVYTLIHLD